MSSGDVIVTISDIPPALGDSVSLAALSGAWSGISIFTFITFHRQKVNKKRGGTNSLKYLHTWPMKHNIMNNARNCSLLNSVFCVLNA